MNDASMAAAVRRLANRGGGIVVVDGAEVLAELPLPVAGLLSDAPLDEVVADSRAVDRGGARARLRARVAVPAPRVPRAVGDPVAEADRPRARRRRPVRARAAGGRMISRQRVDRHVDDAGTEHERRLAADRGRAGRRGRRGRRAGRRRRPRRRGRHAGPRQHAPPPLPDADARAGAAGRPVHVAEDALPDLGADRRRDGVRRRAHAASPSSRSRAATTVFDHHYVFPRGVSGLVEAELRAARELGVRIVASRGSMDLGESDGGLPPDSLVESIDDDPRRHRTARRARRRRPRRRSRSRPARRSR